MLFLNRIFIRPAYGLNFVLNSTTRVFFLLYLRVFTTFVYEWLTTVIDLFRPCIRRVAVAGYNVQKDITPLQVQLLALWKISRIPYIENRDGRDYYFWRS